MRDVAVLIFLIGCIVAALRQPWLGVLALAIFSYLNPHAYAWGFMRTMPVYETLFFAVAIATFTTNDRQRIPRDWRVPTFFLLWTYFFLTTLTAIVPWAAWPKLEEVSKIYLPFIFTLWLINTRRKLYYLIITIAASIGLVAVKGGIFAIVTGFHYRVYGPSGTQFAENNAFAVATNMAIPLIILWQRETENMWLRRGLMAAVPLCMASSLSSWSRGGLLTLATTTAFLTWNSRRRVLVTIPLLAVGIYLATQYLPDEWFDRMHTIEAYQADASAEGRLQAWRDGIQWALQHPFKGAGFEGWIWVSERDWHSSYVEILAEHGFIAFAMWCSLLFGTFISLTLLPRRTRHVPEMRWVENYSLMLRASLVAYATGTAFLGLSYWDIFYHIVFLAVLTKKFALEELATYDAQRERATLPSPKRGYGTAASPLSQIPPA